MIFLFTFSCKGQKSDYKEEDQVDQINMSETKGPNLELPPIGKESHNYIPGEILIKFKDGTDVESIKAIQEKFGLRTIKIMSKQNIYRMKIQNGSSVQEVIKRLQSFKEVEYSEPNYIVKFQ
jgi:hypothetical protein